MQRSTLGRLSVRFTTVSIGALLCATVFAGCSAPSGSGSQNTEPLPTATVPPPSGGSTEETIAPVEPGTTQEVDLGSSADLPSGLAIAVTEVVSLEVSANTPGEIAGPAVALTISVTNSSDAAVDLSTAMVSVTGSAGSYGQATTSDPFNPFLGSVEPGETASAVYVFRLPAEERDALEVRVEYLAGEPVALFVGTI